MRAEDFEMSNYPRQVNGLPASRFWRIGYLDKQGKDRWLPWNKDRDVTFLEDEDIVDIEKKLQGSKITSVRFGCVFFQEEPKGGWFETKLAKNAIAPEHFYEGAFREQYFKARTGAYKRLGVQDIFKLEAPKDEKMIMAEAYEAQIAALKAQLAANTPRS